MRTITFSGRLSYMEERDAKNLEKNEQKKDQNLEARRAAYERKQEGMLEQCKRCMKNGQPSFDHCNYHCSNGKRLRWLEAEYSDVTGWSHQNWRSGMK